MAAAHHTDITHHSLLHRCTASYLEVLRPSAGGVVLKTASQTSYQLRQQLSDAGPAIAAVIEGGWSGSGGIACSADSTLEHCCPDSKLDPYASLSSDEPRYCSCPSGQDLGAAKLPPISKTVCDNTQCLSTASFHPIRLYPTWRNVSERGTGADPSAKQKSKEKKQRRNSGPTDALYC